MMKKEENNKRKKIIELVKSSCLRLIRNSNRTMTLKTILLSLLWFVVFCYACCSYWSICLNNEYPYELSYYGLKLDTAKSYYFVKDYSLPQTENEVVIPVGRRTIPDTLCTLFHNGVEWQLKLSNTLRKDDSDVELKTAMFPFCRLANKEDDKYIFLSPGQIVKEEYLLKNEEKNRNGLIFTHGLSQAGRIYVCIEKNNGAYYLVKGMNVVSGTVPIHRTKETIVEVDFSINGSVDERIKYLYAVPLLINGEARQEYISIHNRKITAAGNVVTLHKEKQYIDISDCRFLIKSKYTNLVISLIGALLVIIFFTSIVGFCFLYNMRKIKMEKAKEKRNAIIVERSSVYYFGIIFNIFILLGFPILILHAPFKVDIVSRLWWLLGIYAIGGVFMALIKCFTNAKENNESSAIDNNKSSGSTLFSWFCILVSVLLLFIACFFNSNESVNVPLLGSVPFLKYSLYILIITGMVNLKNNNWFNKWNRFNKWKWFKRLFRDYGYIALITILILLLALIISDLATLIFFFIASTITILFLYVKRDTLPRVFLVMFLLLMIAIIVFSHWGFDFLIEKALRVKALIYFPDHAVHSDFSTIEASRETFANQFLLLNSLSWNIDFKTVILPENKTVFFTDYSVLWSAKIGGYPWLISYGLTLLFLLHTITSVLILYVREIKLYNGQNVKHSTPFYVSLGIILLVLLIQYIYTFFANLYALPITGQCPGVLSPSKHEYLFHAILMIIMLYQSYNYKKYKGFEGDE